MSKGATIKRNVQEELCTSMEAVEIASRIAGYKVNPSTLQQSVLNGRLFGATIAHVMYVQRKSLIKYAEKLRDGQSMSFKKKAAQVVSEIRRLHPTVQMMIAKSIKV